MTTKADIIQLLQRNDKAIARALLVLNERQTQDEQASEVTKYDNGIGFTGADARMGTSMAQFFAARGYLTDKQLAYWKKPNKNGVWRICKYAGQLLEIANEKAAIMQRKLDVSLSTDLGNLMEEKMVLEEMYDAANERDDEQEAERIGNRLIQIAEAIEEVRRCEYKMIRDMA